MATDILLVRVRPGETRIARISAKNQLKDFAVYRPLSGAQSHARVGDVFLGRVKTIIPAMEAAFVSIGQSRAGFLSLPEARPHQHSGAQAARDRIADHVHEGEALMVQILAEPREDKGAKLTRRISVAGSACVLTPGDPGVRVSKRVRDDAQRNRLRALVTPLLHGDEGCVIRSAALSFSERAIEGELSLLRARWHEIQAHGAEAQPPKRLSGEEAPVIKFLSEGGHGGLAQIVIDDPAQVAGVSEELEKLDALPKDGVVAHPGGRDLFVDFDVADQVDAILDPHVPLKSGGSLIIEETSALTAIDVNAGRGGAGKGGGGAELGLATNIEAVKEAARQMRLRNLGGLIVIDLMAMRGQDAPGRVVAALKDAIAHDPAGPQVMGTTRAGLLEVTRPRRRAPLSHILHQACPTCATGHADSPLTIGLNALDRVLAEVWAEPSLIPALRAASAVVDALQGEAQEALDEMETKLGQPLVLIADDTLAQDRFQIEPAREEI